MRSFLLALTLALSLSTEGVCTSVQASSLSDIEFPVDVDTLVVLDIDDTVISYPSHLGNERWFREEWERTAGSEEFQEMAALLARKVPVVPVEPSTASVIRSWQASGARVVGITARSLEHPILEDWQGVTVSQVESVGVRFDSRSKRPVTSSPSAVRGGIIFAASNPKGEVIVALLETLPVQPKRILFLDDRLSDVRSVEASLSSHDLDLCTVWYRACEGRRGSYDRRLALAELCALARD